MGINQLIRKIRDKLVQIRLRFSVCGDVHYINGPETLPPPLSRQEEEKVMQNIIDDVPNAREPLITHNLRLVVYIAKKFESSNAGVEDLISIGTIGLIKAVNTFCPERNIKLATYASRCIENEILMYLRKSSQLKNEVSIDDPLNVDWDGNELLLSDILGSDQDTVNHNIEQEVERDLLLNAVSRLAPREKKIMQLRFGLNNTKEHTQKEVADTLGISQSYISRLEKRIIERLKKDLERVS
ncbi:MAG: RNA polymerase sporulation sigma factor SigE [Clostridiales bacterium]|nr:RNA polymerase sporulation sigma factor SigE [Clostridiales bacterium]